MYRESYLILFLLGILILVACEDKSTEPIEEKTNTLLPLAVGNTWNYKKYNQSSDSICIETWSILNKTSVDDKEYFLITITGFGNGYLVARSESNGFFLSGFDSTNGFSWPIFFKYPAEENEIYQYQIPETDSILNIKVIKQNLVVNNHNYSCYGYIHLNGNPYFPFMYFAENVGLIRQKLVYNSGHGIDTTIYFIYDLQSLSLTN